MTETFQEVMQTTLRLVRILELVMTESNVCVQK